MALEVLFRVYNDASRDIDAAVLAFPATPGNSPAAVTTEKGWVGGMAVRAASGALSPNGAGLVFGPSTDANGFPAQAAPQTGTVTGFAFAGAATPGFLGVAKNDVQNEIFGSPASGGSGTLNTNSATPSKASVEQGSGTHKIKPSTLRDGTVVYPYGFLTATGAGIGDYVVGDVLKIETKTGKWVNLAVATGAPYGAAGFYETGVANVAGFNAAPVRATVTGLDVANQALTIKVEA